ncbi:18S rRNA maturation protein [Sporothrix eucalyptigena]|uniref:rRNA-processing protein EFG1 n=1 Tax=Sporothrix eucalyptigena TaxID=1812306 RepID=A0ABP0BUZ8_9PEZI
MGEKRQYGDADGGPSAKRYKESGEGGPRHQPGFKKNARRPESSNWAKKRARTIERRLRNPDTLPANVQRDLERELATLQRQIEGRQDKRQRAHMISKYHMLRFFERKKATRRQKQLQKRLDAEENTAVKEELEGDLRVAEIDVLYPQYYPFLQPYVSLYPKKSDDDDEKDEKKDDKDAAQFFRGPRPPMWDEIKMAYEKGGVPALEAIRDRRPAKEGKDGKKVEKGDKAVKAASETNRDKPGKKQKQQEKKVEEESDSDDGGFFGDT